MANPINLAGRQIDNVRYPSNPDDAANKQYVDDTVAAGGVTRAALDAVMAQGVITDPALNLNGTVTWNDAADTFTGWKLAVTDTNSAAASRLMDLQVGGSTKFSVQKNGAVGLNTATPGAAASSTWLDIFGWGILLGADNGATTAITRTDTNTKQAAVVCAHSTNAEEPVCMIQCASGGGVNNVAIGGGLGQYNAATSISFLLAANQTTIIGTTAAQLTQTGFAIGNVTPVARLHIQEDNALTGAAKALIGGTVTWNNGATTMIGYQLTVTDTASAAASLLLDTKIGANSVFQVRKDGSPLILGNTAVPAGGTTGAGVRMSTTANFGVFFGSGAPTLSAAKGSIYLRTDGSSTSTRCYVNTDGATAWTNFTTAT